LEKFIIIILYNSRKILAWLMAIYFVSIIFLRNKYDDVISKFDLPVLFLFIGLYFGMSLMAWIIKYLNKPSIKENPTLRKLLDKKH
jgi:hypothetical protein